MCVCGSGVCVCSVLCNVCAIADVLTAVPLEQFQPFMYTFMCVPFCISDHRDMFHHKMWQSHVEIKNYFAVYFSLRVCGSHMLFSTCMWNMNI